jgi:hypothetical protein
LNPIRVHYQAVLRPDLPLKNGLASGTENFRCPPILSTVC